MKRKGFSLIEIVVIVGVLAIVMTTVTAIMFVTLKSRTRVEKGDIIEQNGALILGELRNNILKSNGLNVSCLQTGQVGVGDSISFINRFDGQTITLSCNDVLTGNKIASSSSAGNFNLNTNEVDISGCNQFVSCDTLPSSGGEVSVVNFSFVLSRGDSGGPVDTYVRRNFENKVVIRK